MREVSAVTSMYLLRFNSQHKELRTQSRYLTDTLNNMKSDLKIAIWRLRGTLLVAQLIEALRY